MNCFINMTFATVGGDNYTLRVSNATDTANSNLVKTTMNKIIETAAVLTKTGNLTERLKATLFKKTETEFDLS